MDYYNQTPCNDLLTNSGYDNQSGLLPNEDCYGYIETSQDIVILWVKIVSVCALILLTLFGNALVVVAICKTPSLKSSATNLFVGKLLLFLTC